jgi:hypothetical protein
MSEPAVLAVQAVLLEDGTPLKVSWSPDGWTCLDCECVRYRCRHVKALIRAIHCAQTRLAEPEVAR